MITLVRAVLADDSGATLVEYALIITMLAITILAGVTGVGGIIKSSFNSIGSAVGSA